MKLTQKQGVGAKACDCVRTSDRCRLHSVSFGYYWYIDLARAKSDDLLNIFILPKQKINSCNRDDGNENSQKDQLVRI